MENNPLVTLVKRFKKLFIIEGVLFTLFGILAMTLPRFFSLTIDYFLAWLFIISATASAVRSVAAPEMPNRAASILTSLLYLTLGILLLVYLMSGIRTLTLLLAFYFLFDGAVKIYGGMQMKPLRSWGWIITSGIMSIILSMVILAYWPTEASWILGVFVGINLFITGITTLGFIWTVSKVL